MYVFGLTNGINMQQKYTTKTFYDPYNQKVQGDQKNANSLRTNHSNGNTWVVSTPETSDDFQTVAILGKKRPKGNYLPRERVLKAKVARAVSTVGNQHPYYAIPETSEQSPQVKSQTTTYWSEDSLAKLSRLLESVKDLMTPEEHSFLKSHGYLKINSRSSLFLKMLKDCYLIILHILTVLTIVI